jgi:hypothetical protein
MRGDTGKPIPFDPDAIPVLAELLSDPSPMVCSRASVLLRAVLNREDPSLIPQDARSAIPALYRALEVDDQEVQLAAREALSLLVPAP